VSGRRPDPPITVPVTLPADRERRRLVISVCSREPGVVVLAIERGGPRRRLDARGIRRELEAVVARRGLGHLVSVGEACVGGCHGDGPNVGVVIYPALRAGERPSQVAIGWRTYVYSIGTLDCLATVVDENLTPDEDAADSAGPTRPVR
jgi:hypothetical protein